MQTCGMSCMKFLVFIFNLLFFIIGLALAILGGASLANDYLERFEAIQSISTELDLNSLQPVAVGIIVIGVIIMLISFFGCCGAYNENKCMLYTFATILGIILLIQIIVGILAFVYRDEVEDKLRDALKKSMTKYGQDSDKNNQTTKGWDVVQKDLDCCGVADKNDWVNVDGTIFFNRTTRPVFPDSCCTDYVDRCAATTGVAYNQGCEAAVVKLIKDVAGPLGGAAIGLGIIQVLGIIFACCLVKEKYGNYV